MGKYTADFKFEVVRQYLEGGLGYGAVAEKFGISNRSLVERWVGFFRHHGKDGLKRKRTHYSAEFKLSVLQHMWENTLSKGQVATVFNIRCHAKVGVWERAYQAGGHDALKPPPKRKSPMLPVPPKAEITEADANLSREELLNELLELRTEVAYLKKLEALVREQKQSAQQKKRK